MAHPNPLGQSGIGAKIPDRTTPPPPTNAAELAAGASSSGREAVKPRTHLHIGGERAAAIHIRHHSCLPAAAVPQRKGRQQPQGRHTAAALPGVNCLFRKPWRRWIKPAASPGDAHAVTPTWCHVCIKTYTVYCVLREGPEGRGLCGVCVGVSWVLLCKHNVGCVGFVLGDRNHRSQLRGDTGRHRHASSLALRRCAAWLIARATAGCMVVALGWAVGEVET